MMPESMSALKSRKRETSSRSGSKRRSNCTCSSGSEGTSLSARISISAISNGRKRQRAVKSVAALLPLSGNARMAVEKSRDQIGLVAIDVSRFAAAHEIAQQRFRDFRIGVRSQGRRSMAGVIAMSSRCSQRYICESVPGSSCSDWRRASSSSPLGTGTAPPSELDRSFW